MSLSKRKSDHIILANRAQTKHLLRDDRFNYEPLYGKHETDLSKLSTKFLNFKLRAPLWISSMTGGSSEGATINHRLAKTAREFGLGMGLGSCRPLLENPKKIKDFNLKKTLGSDLPLFANLGIFQVDQLLREGQAKKISELIDSLSADGLIVHINPLQEFHQKEGDRFVRTPIETITELLSHIKCPLIVKEVGQGMGPKSLSALISLGVSGVELGAFGGTNFSKLEALRQNYEKVKVIKPLVNVGHTAEEMITTLLPLISRRKSFEIIVSGGIETSLDAHYYLSMVKKEALVGLAFALLKEARVSEKRVFYYVENFLAELLIARSFLRLKER